MASQERRRNQQPPPESQGTARRAYALLTRGYLLALALMAATILCTAWFLADLVQDETSDAQVINLAGAQRTLSQRLALLAPGLTAGDVASADVSRAEFQRLLTLMRDTHTRLTTGPDAQARRTPKLARFYFGGDQDASAPVALDGVAQQFFAAAGALAATAAARQPVDASRVQAFRAQATSPVLAALDQAVTLHQAAAQSSVDNALRFHRIATAGTLLLLLAEAALIFWPMSRRLARQTRALAYDASHDALTGALNRRAMSQRIALLQREQRALAVIAIDIDWFKETNESGGQAAGDAVLKALADRVGSAVRQGDLLARVGGDQFVVLLLDCDSSKVADDVAQRLNRTLHQPVEFEGRHLPLGATMGVALAEAGDAGCELALRRADEALRQAKQGRRGSVALASAADDERLRRARELLRSIDALEPAAATPTDGLFVAFQPIVATDATGQAVGVAGVEALARWVHPTLGAISPAEFLGVAQSSGRMQVLGQALLVRGLRDYAGLRQQGLNPGRLSLNLSAAELATAGFVDDFEHHVLQAGLALHDLSLEITEEVLLERVNPKTLAQLQALHERGARLVMDDFGTGTSGLAQLLALPFDTLKIDRVFVQALNAEHRADCIVRATLSLARSMGITVVAEGIETTAQAQTLSTLGCNAVQGFLFARPMAANELAGWMRRQVPAEAPVGA